MVVTADAMFMHKGIIVKIRKEGDDFPIELKAIQPSLRYGVENRHEGRAPAYTYTEDRSSDTDESRAGLIVSTTDLKLYQTRRSVAVI